MKRILLSLLFPLSLLSSELETCYRIYFWFIPVAKSCVHYNKEGKKVRIKSWVKTILIGKIVKPVNSWGEAKMFNLRPVFFSLFQREGSFIRDHYYFFKEFGVEYRIVRHKGGRDILKKGFYRSEAYLNDPFSTSFLIYLDTPNYKGKTLQVFYDEKVQNVYYRTVGEELVEVKGKKFRTWKVLIVPKIETKGLLKPKGKWYVWVDKGTNIPVVLKIRFTVGSANVYLDKLKGDSNLFLEVKRELTIPRGSQASLRSRELKERPPHLYCSPPKGLL